MKSQVEILQPPRVEDASTGISSQTVFQYFDFNLWNIT